MLRIYADFNDMTPDGEMVLINEMTEPNVAAFFVGLRVMLYMTDDFEVEGNLVKLLLEDGREFWYAEPDWTTRRDLF
jgi:hypothetical protein